MRRRDDAQQPNHPPQVERPRGRVGPAPRVRTVLWRGVRRRCPHCGRGPLFVRWITFHRRCAVCGLVLLRNQGDTWLFWIVMDRIPILAGIAAIYFGFRVTGWLSGVLFFLAIAGPLVLTMPQRQGVALALSYLSRVWFPDPSDEMPPLPKRACKDKAALTARKRPGPR